MPDGLNGTVRIVVDGTPYTGTVNDGYGKVDLTGLTGGVKVALVNFTSEDNKFKADTTVKFVVYRASSTVHVTTSGTSVTATVTTGATGTVTFYINGIDYGEVTISGNTATLNGVLPIGNNSVVAIYNGDINYNGSDDSTYHIVPKHSTWISELNVTNIREGDTETIDVAIYPFVHTDINGSVVIRINDIAYYVNFTNGTAHFDVSGLREGNYTVNVTYLGNSVYYGSSATANFTVSKIKLNVTGTGNETKVNVTVTDNSTGNITLIINNTEYKTNITNGTGTVELGNLTPGVHNATIIYVDNNGTTSVINTTVEVPKWTADIDVEVKEAINGTTVVVTVKPATDGLVLVRLFVKVQ